MISPSFLQTYSSFSPASVQTDLSPNPTNKSIDDKPPGKPDWLLILVSILFLLTLFIAWLVDVPVLGR
ncbi:hypothetical protein [Spirosoma arcticum]